MRYQSRSTNKTKIAAMKEKDVGSSVTPNATRQGAFHNLIGEMRLSDPEKHFNYLRMTKETFDLLGL